MLVVGYDSTKSPPNRKSCIPDMLPCVVQAIEGYRETEKTQWSDCSTALIERLRRETALATATPEDEGLETLQEIHVLDLAADGEIKPHVDSIKVYLYSVCLVCV